MYQREAWLMLNPWIDSGSADVTELVAKAAHACWCEQMTRDGWSFGCAFDENLKHHDALKSFDSLERRDKRLALFNIEAEELGSRLADAIDHERGPARELLLEEMKVGLRVGWNRDAFDEVDEIDLEELGVIVEWDVEEDGTELRSIEVQWDDGQRTTFYPCQRELRRVDPL